MTITRAQAAELLEPKLSKIWYEAFPQWPFKYTAFTNTRNTQKATVTDWRMTDFGPLVLKAEGQNITYDDWIPGDEIAYVPIRKALGYKIPKQTRDGWPVLMGPDVRPGLADTFIAYGRGWANVSNTPFREYKHWVHEGGIATPLIAHWPKGIPSIQVGKLLNEPGHVIDIMPTCIEVSGAAYPKTFHEPQQRITRLQGLSLVPVFGGRHLDREGIYWEHEGNVAIRVGKWKAVAKHGGYKRDRWELYDLEQDRTEMNNLATAKPEKLAALKAQWLAFAEKANFLPVNGGRGAGEPRQKSASDPKRKTDG